jgi:hypothetical protein
MSNRNSGLSIDASYQLESKTSANQKQESPVVAMFANGLKPLGQMYRDVVGCIYGRSSIKIAHFVLIH